MYIYIHIYIYIYILDISSKVRYLSMANRNSSSEKFHKLHWKTPVRQSFLVKFQPHTTF